MKYKASTPEKIAKSFVYCVLSTGFAFFLMLPFSFWGGAAGSKATPARAEWIFSILDSPIFYITLICFWVIAIYSALKGIPSWVVFSMKVLASIALLPMTIEAAITERKWIFSDDESI